MKKYLCFALFAFVFTFNAQAQDCPRIFLRGDTLYTDPAPQYQWFRDNNPINGATKQWYVPTKGGNFSVQVSGTTANFSYEQPTTGKSVSGRIVDERYEPIADALISFGTKNVKSDAEGRFFLTGLDTTLATAVVSITKEGFWKNTQRVHFFDQDIAPLTAMLEPLKVTNRFDAQKGATISERGFFLTFPPNSAVTESGQTYMGTINISLKRSFPSEDGFGLRMPGGDFSAIDQKGQEKMLVSYGFMSAEMQGSKGEKLKLASDKEATLEFYIPWEQNKTAPDSMPLWHFDETAGTWRPEGTARKVGPRYVGTVKHFSSWNCDAPKNRATVKGKARNCKGTLIPNVVISVGQRTVTANANGEYTSYVPSDTEFDVTANVDTTTVTPLTEGEVREVQDLGGSGVLRAVGLIDSTGSLTVWGVGLENYSVDSGKTFHPKAQKITLKANTLPQGIGLDSAGCKQTRFSIIRVHKNNDCQVVKEWSEGIVSYDDLTQALGITETVFWLKFMNSQEKPDLEMVNDYFPCLQRLEATNFTLGNSFPESISNMSSLTWLDLNRNGLGKIPNFIGQLHNLQTLNLQVNQLNKFPVSLGQLINLQSLNLSTNVMSFISDSIGQLTNLQTLDLYSNGLDSLPESIGQLTNLQTLNLSDNRLDSLPESIGLLSSLQTLDLSKNNLSSLPESFGQLKSLQKLDLTNNYYLTLSATIADLKDNLKTLYLSRLNFTQAEQDQIHLWLPNTDVRFN